MMPGRSLPDRVKRVFRLDLGRRKAVEEETDEELRFHLDQRIRDLMAAGRTREEAVAEALERFGPYDESRARMLAAARQREQTLTMLDRMDALRDDIRYAFRQLRRAPGFTATVIATFALGIGANATMFGVVDQLLLRPPAHVRAPEQIVTFAAGAAGRGYGQRTFNYPSFRAIRDHTTGFEQVAAAAAVSVPFGRGENAQDISGLIVTASYFPMLGVSPARGRFFRADEDIEPRGAPVVVISDAFWKRQFQGREDVLGTVLDLGDGRYTVIGITPKGFTGLDLAGPDVWVPMTAAGALQPAGSRWSTSSIGSWLRMCARIRPDVPPERAADDALRVVREAAPDAFFAGRGWTFTALPIASTRAGDQGANATVATLLGAMSLIVLLIACANVANLLLARGLRRRREAAVRLALGVSRGRLMRQLVTESLALAALGGAAALLVAFWGGGLVRALLFPDLGLEISPVDHRILAFTAAAAVVTGLLTGILPALQASRAEITSALKAGTREGGGRRSPTRSVLLVVQAAMCLVLLVGAGLFVRSLVRLNAMPLGIDIDRVLIGSMNLQSVGRPQSDVDAIFALALERVQATPGVEFAAVAATVPFGQSFGVDVGIPGPDSLTHASSMLNAVTPDYFRTLGARILSGRDFSPSDGEGAPRVVVISEMLAARYWGTTSPIGRCVRIGSDTTPCTEVIGVVTNVRRQSIFDDSTGFTYFPLAQVRRQLPYRQLVARVHDGDAARLIEPLRLAMQTAAPQLPFADVHLAADEPTVRQELRPFRLGAAMFGVFGALALVLAAVGVYGVVSYDVAQRTQEMGVRIALGAQSRDVAGLVMRAGVTVVTFGVAIGIVLALLGGRFIAPLLYQVSPRDPLVLGSVAATLVLVAIVACLVPAWRAMRVDAVVALRAE